MRKLKVSFIVFAVIIALLVGLRVALPGIVRDQINQHGEHIGDYRVHVADVDLHLWRGAYSIHGMLIDKTSGKVPVPLAKIPTIDLSVSWRALWEGGVAATVHFIRPEINFVDGGGEADSQAGGGVDWREQLERLLPIRLDEVRVSDGTLRFANFISRPKVDLHATDVDAVVTNLTNVRDERERRAAVLKGTANVLDGAPLETEARFDPFTGIQEFGLDLRVKKIELPRLNDFFKAYAMIDVERGNGDIVLQMEARDGQVSGYAKPLFHDVDVVDFKEDIKNPLKLAWEALAGGLIAIFKNHPEDQFATRIQFEGSVNNPDISVWQSIKGIFHNAFVKALEPNFDLGDKAAPKSGPKDEDKAEKAADKALPKH